MLSRRMRGYHRGEEIPHPAYLASLDFATLSRKGRGCNPATINARVRPGHGEGLGEINQANPVGDQSGFFLALDLDRNAGA